MEASRHSIHSGAGASSSLYSPQVVAAFFAPVDRAGDTNRRRAAVQSRIPGIQTTIHVYVSGIARRGQIFERDTLSKGILGTSESGAKSNSLPIKKRVWLFQSHLLYNENKSSSPKRSGASPAFLAASPPASNSALSNCNCFLLPIYLPSPR
jgi:hypothetical protein